MATAGHRTLSTGPSCSRVTNGFDVDWRQAWTPIASDATIRMTPSQNGKNPLWGPSVPQPIPIRIESRTTTPPRRTRMVAVARSTVRMLLLQQPALGHQLLVKQLVVLDPLDVLGARREGRLEGAVLRVLLPLRRLGDLLEEADVPVDRVLRHARRAEDAPEHQIAHVDAERLLDRGDVLPVTHGDARGVEDGQRAHLARFPMAHALDGVVHGRVHVLADEVHAHLAAALEGHVAELGAGEALLELDR